VDLRNMLATLSKVDAEEAERATSELAGSMTREMVVDLANIIGNVQTPKEYFTAAACLFSFSEDDEWCELLQDPELNAVVFCALVDALTTRYQIDETAPSVLAALDEFITEHGLTKDVYLEAMPILRAKARSAEPERPFKIECVKTLIMLSCTR